MKASTAVENGDPLQKWLRVAINPISKGYQQHWRGCELHLDVADGGIPITCLLTSASLQDSQTAIPMATLTAQRVTSLYDLMHAAYDAKAIAEHSRSLGHVPVIAPNGAPVPVPKRVQEAGVAKTSGARWSLTPPGSVRQCRPPSNSANECAVYPSR